MSADVVASATQTEVSSCIFMRSFANADRCLAFRARTNGRNAPRDALAENRNRDNPTEGNDGQVRGRDSGPGTQRGGRGQRGPRRGGDRQDKTGRS